jgi:hypothetical protein
MSYNVDDIKKDVRVALDQNMISTQLANLGDIDTLSLDDIIESKIIDAAKIAETKAPISLIDNAVSLPVGTINWKSAVGVGMGEIDLPADFMRLVIFRMSDWSRSGKVITDVDPLYALQSSRFPGIRGNPQKPVVAICRYPTKLALEFYSSTAGSSIFVRQASYLAIPSISETDGKKTIDISSLCYRSVVYFTAYLTALAYFDDSKNLESLKETAETFLKI